jgi:hypothetical protein
MVRVATTAVNNDKPVPIAKVKAKPLITEDENQ